MLLVANWRDFDAVHELAPGLHLGRLASGYGWSASDRDHLILNQTIALSAKELLRPDQRRDGSDLGAEWSPHRLARWDAPDFDAFLDRERDIERAEFTPNNARGDLDSYLERAGLPTSRWQGAENAERLHGSPAFPGATRAGDRFFRFSAFRNDRRVGPGGVLLPGCYCTSASDRAVVPNALAAVGRYALPSILVPVHLFAVYPPPGTPMLYGTVLPNFGQAGGGAEMEFVFGLPAGCVSYMGTIPEW